MRLYEDDDSDEIRPSFSIGDEKQNTNTEDDVIVPERKPERKKENDRAYYEERMASLQPDPVARVQTKLNIVAVMIPCIMTVVLGIMYFNIKKELTVIQNSGSAELKNISLEIQQKVTNLENRVAAFEQKVNADIATVNDSAKAAGAKADQANQISQSKADKKDFDSFNTNASARLEQIQKSASETATATADRIKKDIDANIIQMQKSVDSAMKSASDLEKNIKPEIEALKGSVSDVSGIAKAAQKEVAGLKAADFATSDDMKSETSRLESKIKELEQKIAAQSKAAAASAAATAKASKNSESVPKAKEAAVPSPSSSKGKTAASKPAAKTVESEPADDFEEPPIDEEPPASKTMKHVTSPASKPVKSKAGINEQDL